MRIGGMDCPSCAIKIEGSLQRLTGIAEASVNGATGWLTVSYDPRQVNEVEIQNRVQSLGYTLKVERSPVCGTVAEPYNPDHTRHGHNHGQGAGEFNLKEELLPVLVVVGLFTLGIIFEEPLHKTPFRLGEYVMFIPAYLISGWTVLKSAGRNSFRGQVFDENFLMTIATLGAIVIHKLPEAVGVMLFFKVGELFQELAVSRSRRSIQSLLEIRPDFANLKTESGIQTVSPEVVKLGDTILVKPGEKIPLDGEVLEGNSQVDTSALTGESTPRTVEVGETVLAGMINQTGVLTVKVTKRFGESSIARILDLVENANSKKAETEKFITKFARRYTPIVVVLSLAVAIVPPLLSLGTNAEWTYRALILLVISCPCGLVISIPLGYFGGIGGAAKRGILVKGATFLDTLAAVKVVVFDKTGTLTQGAFKVAQVSNHNGFTREALLRLAAEAEFHSNHPIAKSIREAYGKPINVSAITDYSEIAGCGIRATVENRVVIAGNDRLLHQEHIEHDICHIEGTVVHLAVDQRYAGYIVIADQLKPDAAQAIQALKRLGVEQVIMLTGDDQSVAERLARTLKLDSFQAELLPEDKVTAVEHLLQKVGKQDKVAFVGDGINDAPVIARADVGLAMGGLGSDAAIETADVVIMTDAPSKVAEAMQVARNTHAIVWQNIILALTVKSVFIALGAFGLATMWEAVFADVGVALMAIFNASRVLRSGNSYAVIRVPEGLH
jgi:Cd2+/Zn2+-exporting ATPase